MKLVYSSIFFLYLLPLFLLSIVVSTGKAHAVSTLPYYHLQVHVTPHKHEIRTDLSIRFGAGYLSEGKVQLLIAQSTQIEQIKAPGMYRYEIIELDESLKQITLYFEDVHSSELLVQFNYSLKIPVDHPINRITKNWIELNIDSFWHPVFVTFPRFNYHMELNIEDSYEVKTGDRIEESNHPGQVIIQNLIPRRDISFSAAPGFYTKRGKYSEVYSLKASPRVDSVQLLSDQALKFLETYIDEPADFEYTRQIIISPRKEVGYARKNYIVLSDVSKQTEEDLSSFIAHEFSHYWFSEANLNSKHHWLTESFAEYLSMIYIRKAYGKKAFKRDVEKKRERIKEETKTLAEFTERPSYLALYHRGPLVLEAFESFLGKKKFKKLLNQMVDLNISTNEELFAEVEKLFGENALIKLKELRAGI